MLEPSADYFKNPCLLELGKNAIEVDLRVPGNDIKFPFPPSYFPRFDSVPVRKPKNILQLENLMNLSLTEKVVEVFLRIFPK